MDSTITIDWVQLGWLILNIGVGALAWGFLFYITEPKSKRDGVAIFVLVVIITAISNNIPEYFGKAFS